jgi:hypothetical protein
MRNFMDIVNEVEASADLRASRLYHGTKTQTAAEVILRDGIRPGVTTPGKRGLAVPVVGKVYLTTSIEYACIYAIGGVFMGHDFFSARPEKLERDGRYGFVFVVNGEDLADVQPDEDSVGEFVMKHTDRSFDSSYVGWRYAFRPDGIEDQRKRMVWHNIRHGMTSLQFKKAVDGEVAYQAAGGKRALRSLPDQDKMDLIRWGAHIAHEGIIRSVEAWRIDKMRTREIARDASNFFEIAERVL